ncbi:MAG TPA: tetratricopeptide repeat protein [Azospirillum sp.]|nr:tetratricopeptide repeat protein [Azospirillum sp.]
MAAIGEVLLIALDHLEAGRFDKAQALCGRILKVDPAQADAWHIAGIAAVRKGRVAEARRHFAMAVTHAPARMDFRLNHVLALAALSFPKAPALRHALALEPAHADAWLMLAEATAREDGPGAAAGSWRALAALQPDSALARYNLGVALQQSGQLAEAVTAYAEAARIEPTLAEAHFNRANALRDLGQADAAARAYRASLAVDPAGRGAARNLGILRLPTDPAAAVAAFRIAAAVDPGSVDPHNVDDGLNLAAALIAAARPAEALPVLDRVLARRPDAADAHNHRALALCALGRKADEAAALVRALATAPAFPEAWTNRAQERRDRGRFGEATAAARRALRIRPAYPAAFGVLARIRHGAGRPEEAVAILRRAMAVDPQLPRGLHSDYLFVRQSDPGADPGSLLIEHRRWALLHAPPPGHGASPPALPAGRAAGRILRIGYLSADLCTHSVANFFEPLLAAHDRRTVHTVCYAALRHPDATTARLQSLAGDWRNVAGLGDAALAALIRADGIDVLIDLGGHTGDSRLAVLALAPAPVRLTTLGYPGTTGLPIEGRLTDPIIEPPGAESWSSEPLIRLPHGFLCYHPPDDAPEPHRDRSADGEGIVFGSFNALGKLTPAVVAAWTGILSDVPGARLLLKSQALGDEAVAAELRARFAARGIASDRLEFVAWTANRAEHLALYRRVDVGLDPFPYNGTTTTCEAMWMGVPVVTLAGDRHAARVGAALLTRVGLPDLTARDVAAYHRIAVTLAADTGRRTELRAGLRERMRRSPLGDAAALAAAVEAACRALVS